MNITKIWLLVCNSMPSSAIRRAYNVLKERFDSNYRDIDAFIVLYVENFFGCSNTVRQGPMEAVLRPLHMNFRYNCWDRTKRLPLQNQIHYRDPVEYGVLGV